MAKQNLKELHKAWCAADIAFTSAISVAFPKAWPGDVRFTPKAKGEDGSALREAYDALQRARDAFHDAGGAEWLQGKSLGRPPVL